MAPGRQVLAPVIFPTRWAQVCAALTAMIVCRMVYVSALQPVLLVRMTTTPEYEDVHIQIFTWRDAACVAIASRKSPILLTHVVFLVYLRRIAIYSSPVQLSRCEDGSFCPRSPGQCEPDLLRCRSGKDGRALPGAHRRELSQQYSWSFVDNLTSILRRAIRHTHVCFHEFSSHLYLGSDSAKDYYEG